jgi:hypothetical protein
MAERNFCGSYQIVLIVDFGMWNHRQICCCLSVASDLPEMQKPMNAY